MERHGPLRPLLITLVALVLLWLVGGPAAHLAVGSLRDDGVVPARWSLVGWASFLTGSPAAREALANSLLLALGSVVLAALIGVPLGFLFARCDFPGRNWLAALATVPVLLPPLVGTLAFYFLYAPSGVVTRLVQAALGLDSPPWRFRGMGAVLAIHAYSFYPYFYTFVSAGLQRLDESRPEAAATLGASRARVLATVALPLLTPALAGAALLTFMMSMASFTAPYVIGGVRVLTTQLLEARQLPSQALMRVETLVLAGICVLFLALLRRVEGRGRYHGGVKGGTARRRVADRGWQRLALGAAGALAVVLMLLPHAMLLLLSFADAAAWTTQVLPPRYSLAAWRWLATDPEGRLPLVNSFTMAVGATAANLAFALPAAWLFGRDAFRGRRALESLALLPYAVPGTVIGLTLAEWFSARQPWLGRLVLINTWAILPLAYFVRSLPLTLRAVQASLAQVDPSLEEAAATLGASPGRRLRTIVAPLVAPGLVVGGSLAFVAAMGEFVASVVLYTPANRPVAIEIWNQLRGAYFARACGYGVLLVLVIALVLALARGTATEAAGR